MIFFLKGKHQRRQILFISKSITKGYTAGPVKEIKGANSDPTYEGMNKAERNRNLEI